MKTLDLHQIDNSQDRFGRNVAARLSDTSQGISPDISERLKAARMLALSKRKVVKLQTASNINTNGSAATLNSGDADNGLWNRLGSIIPLLALVAGLLAIAVIQEQRVTKEIADVDVELLADDLPPAAFTDPGFVRYLSTNRRD
jgi:hypothetical protein